MLMDGERDQYEERLKEVFESFDGSGLGSLCPEELTDLCRALQLEENTLNTLLHTLLQEQITARVDFEQFKDALILVLSSTNTADSQECPEQPDSSEVQPRFVKGSKRYGRRSAPEFIHTHTDSNTNVEDEDEEDEDAQECDDRTVPRKRERWNADVSISEEFEAEGQLHLWNPDEPGTPRGNAASICDLEERLHSACHQLSLPLNGTATLQQLHTLCQHVGLEVGEDLSQCADESVMNVQEFVSYIINHSKPPTPSASTPYRQLKRHHSTQFDETGRRISCALSSTIGLRLFSVLDDGSGHAPAENLLYRWMEEGVDNSSEILQALDFNLEGKVNLSELAVALENELLSTKNSIHQAALVSFKAEIRHLLECVDLERREKERIRSDLDKTEKLKSQLASEVDDHHAAIERNNELNLRKLEQEYKESMTALRAELSKEVELVQQHANQQREELEQEICKMRDDEVFLREHLTLSIKENGRLETELLESTEKLVEAENQLDKLQKNLDGALKERFGDLDPDSAEFYQQEERLRQLRRNYEEQCRELQDQIDELEAQLAQYQTSGHTPLTRPGQSLSDELSNKSPDPGTQEQQPMNMSLETEMLLEQHQREMENIRAMVSEEQRCAEEESRRLSLQHQQEVQVLREEMERELERANKLEQELSALHTLHQQEFSSRTQEAQDARSRAEQLEEQVRVLEEKQTAYEEQSRAHAEEINMMESRHQEALEARLQEERERLQGEKENEERRLTEQWEQVQEHLQRSHQEALSAQLEEVQQRAEQERSELERRIKEEWERERQELEESSREALQAMLKEREESERRLGEQWEQEKQELVESSKEVLQALLKEKEETEKRLREEWEQERQELEETSKEALQVLLEEREERERRLKQQWDEERALLEEERHAALLQCLEEERERQRTQQELTENMMMEHWRRERAQLEKRHEEMLQACLEQERERLQVEREEQERRWQEVLNEEQNRMEEAHREAMQELSAKHSEERERLSGLLEKLRLDIAEERKELEKHFSQRLTEVEVRFYGDQEVVSERFQMDVCKLEQHYQSELKALAQQHAAECTRWEEESEAATQEAEQQRKLLREALEVEREELKMECQRLELKHSQDIKALTDKNLQLQTEMETFVSAAQTKEIELSRQLNELHDRLQENIETKDLLLAQAEHKASELEAMLQQAVDDFIQERAELQRSLSALESRQGEVPSLSESMELTGKIQEAEKLLHQAAEDFMNERLELEEKLKESISMVMVKEGERLVLVAERDTLALRVVQLEEKLLLLTGASEEPCEELTEQSCIKSTVESIQEGHEETCKEYTVELCESTKEACTEPTGEASQQDQTDLCEDETTDQLEARITPVSDLNSTAENECLLDSKIEDTSNEETLSVPVEVLQTSHAEVVSGPGPNQSDECWEDRSQQNSTERSESDHTLEDNEKDNIVEHLESSGVFIDNTPEIHTDAEPYHAEGDSAGVINDEARDDEEEAGLVDENTDPEFDGSTCPHRSPECADTEFTTSDSCAEDNCLRLNMPDVESSISGIESSELSNLKEQEANIEDKQAMETSAEEDLCNSGAIENVNENVEEFQNAESSTTENQGQTEGTDTDADLAEPENTKDKNTAESEKAEFCNMQGAVCSETLEMTESDILNVTEICDGALVDPKMANSTEYITDQEHKIMEDTETIEGNEIASDDALPEKLDNDPDVLEAHISAEVEASHNEESLQHMESPDSDDSQTKNEISIASLEKQVTALVKDVCATTAVDTTQGSIAGMRDVYIQEIMDLQEMVMEYSRGENMLPKNKELLADPTSEVEVKELELSELNICYEQSLYENLQLLEHNRKLERRVKNLESKMHIVQDFYKQQASLLEETTKLHAENSKLKELLQELEKQNEVQQWDSDSNVSSNDSVLELNSQLKEKIAAVAELELFCIEFEKQNARLREALADLQGKSLRIHEQVQEQRSKVCRVAEENLILRHKISTVRAEDLRETQEDPRLNLQHIKPGKRTAFRRQLSENNVLLQQNVEHVLRHPFQEVMRHHDNSPANEKNGLCDRDEFLSRTEKDLLRSELNRCIEKMAHLSSVEMQVAQLLHEKQTTDKHNQALHTQLTKTQEKVMLLESSLQTLTQQNTRLKSDLRLIQQERDALKQEVISLHKQMHNANEKLLEVSAVSAGQQQGRRVWAELSGLMEAEHASLTDENQQLKRQMSEMSSELQTANEQIRQLEALSVKQRSLVKTADQEKSALKREMEALHTQLLSTRNKTQLAALSPSSPLQLPGQQRGQCYSDGPNFNMQDEREVALIQMEERMREVELTLRNLKLLLQEKVSQLKEQLSRNGESDVLIKDLYVENAQLLKALEKTEQRQKVAEKKNFLLEEKISSLNKIVRDLGPSPLTPTPYHFTRS